MTQPAPSRMSYDEYLAAEEASDVKHEYLRSEVYAMAGGTPEHAALAASVIGEIRNAIRDRPCRVFGPDLRVRVEATDLSTYPDVTVVCGKLERADIDERAVTNPTLVVEVLSDSTEAYDRGQKFAHYRRLPSLQEYLLVSQDEPRLELYRKNEAGHWVLFEAGKGEKVTLSSLGDAKIATDDVYWNPLE